MRVLFFAERSHLRHFEEVFDEFFKRGHEVKVVFEVVRRKKRPYRGPIEELTVEQLLFEERGEWLDIGNTIRWTRNQVFFADPRFDEHRFLQHRLEHLVDPLVAPILRRRQPLLIRSLDRALRRLDGALPLPGHVLRLLEQYRPDVVIVTPLIFAAHVHQYDYLRCARAIGIPACYPVFSWDNLTTKGTLLREPDLTLVWNSIQVDEAVSLHGVNRSKVATCGAYRFEGFQKRRASQDRATYLTGLGLDPLQRVLLYIGSSPLCAPHEGVFTKEWLTHIRAHGAGDVAHANVILRPHPKNRRSFNKDPFFEQHGVHLVREASFVDDQQDLYDALTYSDAVVGINTSAMLEAALLKRPVYSVMNPTTRAWQQRTIHFRYLTEAYNGLLHMASTLDDHMDQIRAGLQDRGPDPRSAHFADQFLAVDGSPAPSARFVDAIEKLAAEHRRTASRGAVRRIVDEGLRALMASHVLPIRQIPRERVKELEREHLSRLERH